jgi:hypothetical protein
MLGKSPDDPCSTAVGGSNLLRLSPMASPRAGWVSHPGQLRPRSVPAGLLLCLLAFAGLPGCAINRQSTSVAPDVDLAPLRRFYVVKPAPDEHAMDGVIASELRRLGFEASTGPDSSRPTDVDAIVTYQDTWQWDITMYLLELRVFVREPRGDALLAVGISFHTSAKRKSPEEMAAEVLSGIFGASGRAPQGSR